jgi:hypothetical protein
MQVFCDNLHTNVLDSHYIEEEQRNYGKTKSGFIFPLLYTVLLIDESQYFVKFQTQNTMKFQIHIITNEEGIISDISSSAALYFNFELSAIKLGKLNIEEMIPNILEDLEFRTGKDTLISQSSANGLFFCVVSPIQLHLEAGSQEDFDEELKESNIVGFLLRFEKQE